MAKKIMTLEEKLEEAIVKEVPYEVPKNWIWSNFDNVFKNVTSSNKKIMQKNYEKYSTDFIIPIIDQGEAFIGGYTDNENFIYGGELPVLIFGDHSKCIKYVDFNFVQGADGVKVLLSKGMNEKYLYYMLLNLELPDKGYSRHYKFLREAIIPIAPLKEQQRIVDKIESLFEKLDKSKELIEEARDGFEKRKAAILESALRGNITNYWRSINNIKFYESWKNRIFEDLCVVSRGFDLPSRLRVEGEYKLVSSSGVIDTHNEFKAIGPGVATGRSGSIGKVFYIEENYWPLNTTLYVKDFKKNNEKYVYYYMSSFDLKKFSSSTAVPTLNRNNFKDEPVKFPIYKEQKEIVKILDKIFKEENKIEELTQLEEQIELIKKSILAKAFRGELGTNCEDEESSLELLKEILSKQ